jgi:ceramide glucosyltransferase
MFYAASLLLIVVAGSLVYCLLVVYAARHYLRASRRTSPSVAQTPVSVLKPLHGADEGLEENLRSFFTQACSSYELLFAVRHENDAAVPVVRKLQHDYPGIPSKLLTVGDPPYPNAKVWSLERMTAEARHDILVMSDSDIRVGPDMLAVIADEFRDPLVGVTTCPYRAVPGRSFWSTLEAIGMNTEFIGGVLVARIVEGMKFALGPTASARKRVIAEMGGWPRLSEYLAEDFVLGNIAAEKGWKVLLSGYVIEHRIGSARFAENAKHRLRWYRSTRRSRPAGYLGQLFTNPLPLSLLLAAIWPAWWIVVPVTGAARVLAAYAAAGWVLHDRLTAKSWYLVPLQDAMSFIFWIAGFFGSTITWRGRKYAVLPDGRLQLLR